LHIFKCLNGVVSIAILPDSNHSVEHKDQKNNERLNIGRQTLFTVSSDSDDERNSCSYEKDLDQNIIELLCDSLPKTLVFLSIKFIRAILGESILSL